MRAATKSKVPFTDYGRLHPDAKGRVTLGKVAEGVSSYKASIDREGRILLEPFAEIPAHERWLYKNPEADRKSTRLNSSHIQKSRMPSSA